MDQLSLGEIQEMLAANPGPVQLISNMHGHMGTFNSRVEAMDFAKKMGIPIGPASDPSKTGYFLQPVKIGG